MKAKRGRLTVYTEAIADEICERLAAGESLISICTEPYMPSDSVVQLWVQEESEARPGFVGKYARARQCGFYRMAEQIIAIGDADCTGPDGFVDNGAVQRARLMSDNRKWLLSKMLPKQFGDRVTQEITGDASSPIVTRIELVPVAPPPRSDEAGEVSSLPAARGRPALRLDRAFEAPNDGQ